MNQSAAMLGHWVVALCACLATTLIAVVESKEYLLAVGGYNYSYYIGYDGMQSVELYNVSTGRWRSLAPLPGINGRARQGTALLPLTSKGFPEVMVCGGEQWTGQVHWLVWSCIQYDPLADSWTTIETPQMPKYTLDNSLTTLSGGRWILSVGGSDSMGGSIATVQRYDAKRNQWDLMEDFPVPICQHAATIWNGSLYIAGGVAYNQQGQLVANYASLWRYVAEVDVWDSLEPMHSARAEFGLVPRDGFLYAIDTAQQKVERYDPVKNQWYLGPKEVPKPPLPFAGVGIAVTQGDNGGGQTIHMIGGKSSSGRYAETHFILGGESRVWEEAAPIPYGRWLFTLNTITVKD